MSFGFVTVPGLPRARVSIALAAATLIVSTLAYAQQPTAPTAAGTPAEAREQPAGQQLQLIYTPWTKYCLKAPDGKQTCFIGKDGRIDSDKVLIAAVIVESDGEPKVLRITLPLGMLLVHGTRVIVDNNPPAQNPYVMCFANGCMSDYAVTPELIANMKTGQNLVVQAITSTGAPLALLVPLQETNGGFAKAFEGQPPDPTVIEDNYKKLREELQSRADARQKLQEAQPPAAATMPAPAEK
jgi:invasion protein IalB